MAPTAPQKRKSLRLKATERLANPHLPRKVHRPDSAVTDTFLTSKTDKRLIKHSSFISRIAKPSTISASRKNAKRHEKRKLDARNGKKSLTTMDALVDALPELTSEEVRRGAAEKDGKVLGKSLGSKRGSLKRRERVVRGEMERFGLRLAQLQGVSEQQQQQQQQQQPPRVAAATAQGDAQMEGTGEAAAPPRSAAANRFAALRGLIASTMEVNPAFAARDAAMAAAKGP